MRRALFPLVGLAAVSVTLLAQTPGPTFDVTSIKQNFEHKQPLNAIDLNFLREGGRTQRNGRFSMQGLAAVPLTMLIQLAYNVREFQIRGGPAWTGTDRYDVDARAAEPAPFEQMRPMLQQLLSDRFKLSLRRVTSESPVYELTASRGGLKVAAIKDGDCITVIPGAPRPPSVEFGGPLNICGGVRRQTIPSSSDRRDRIEAAGVPMSKLVEFLTEESGRIVVDKTGFTDRFSFTLDFASQRDAGALVAPSTSAPSIFAAVQEQLGMELKPARGPVEVLVIDHVERPTEN